MAKKKVQTGRKHRFKHTEPGAATEHIQQMSAVTAAATTKVTTPAVAPSGRDFSYVSSDMRRILLLAGVLFAVELVIWYLINHTGFGSNLYTWVKV